jgi:hypothetical protein
LLRAQLRGGLPETPFSRHRFQFRRIENMADKPMKIPGPDHPISIDANPSRIVVTVGGKVIADTRDALTLREASYPAVSLSQESSSNRCVFVVSSLAGIILKLPRVSYPTNASATTGDAKPVGVGCERPPGLSRPFSSCRMWSVSAGY